MQLVDPLLKFVISSQSFSIFVEVHETSYILLYLTPLFLILSDWKNEVFLHQFKFAEISF